MTETYTNQQLIDLHAHSRIIAKFLPSEGVLYSPYDLVDQAKELNIGVAHTPHDTIQGAYELLDAGTDLSVTVVPGVEVTSFTGRNIPHIIGLFPGMVALEMESKGINPPSGRKPRYVAEWIHGHDGVVIAPHPRPKGNNVSLSFKRLEKLAARGLLDGVEVATRCYPKKTGAFAERAAQLGLAAIGSSDAHSLEQVGIAATLLEGLPAGFIKSDDVIQAVRDRSTQAIKLRETTDRHMIEGPWASQLRRYKEAAKQRKQDKREESQKGSLA